MAPKTVAAGGRIERRYLQLKLARDRRKYASLSSVANYIGELQKWLREQKTRTTRKGGLGR